MQGCRSKSAWGSVEWRCCITLDGPADYVAREARCADLIVTSGSKGKGLGVNSGDLIMESGRPVLSIPANVDALKFAHVIVAWKETREARRAVAAAVPLLKIASRVSIIEMAEQGDMEAAQERGQDVAQLACTARHPRRGDVRSLGER